VSGDRTDVSCDRAIQASHHCLMPAAPSKLTRSSASRFATSHLWSVDSTT
jgi:hypothetical protein